MQKDKMAQSYLCFIDEIETISSPGSAQSPSTPKNPLRSSADRWKRKYEELKEQYEKEMKTKRVYRKSSIIITTLPLLELLTLYIPGMYQKYNFPCWK